MMQRQVLSRFIPKIDSEAWSNTKEYESLTIVKSSNIVYISKKDVPVGVDILNTEYWFVYATDETSEMLEQLTTSINTINSLINGLNTTFTNHINNFNNPHAVTKEQIGLGNVVNKDTSQTINITSSSGDNLDLMLNGLLDSLSNLQNQNSDAITRLRCGGIIY